MQRQEKREKYWKAGISAWVLWCWGLLGHNPHHMVNLDFCLLVLGLHQRCLRVTPDSAVGQYVMPGIGPGPATCKAAVPSPAPAVVKMFIESKETMEQVDSQAQGSIGENEKTTSRKDKNEV